MLSKKYYIELASILRSSENLEEFKSKLISFMKCDNERFDEWKFREALKV